MESRGSGSATIVAILVAKFGVNSSFAGELLQRLFEFDAVLAHYEIEHVATDAARSPTSPCSMFRGDAERRCSFLVERAESFGRARRRIVEGKIVRHNINDGQSSFDFVD